MVFRRFIAVFARPEHPLALFLDDLQWLDAATLDLLEYLLTRDDLRHLFLIGAYRDNEVSATHPLMRKLDAIRQAGAAVEDIVLTSLGEDGRIVEANDAFLDMLQYRREDLVSGGVRWTDLTPSEWREQDERATADLKATGTVQPYEKEFFRKDGTRIAVLTGGALFDLQGTDGVAFAFDLSQQKQAEAEIRTLKDQLYRENLALRDEVDRAQMFEEIIGSSKPLKTVLSRIAKVAPTDSTVFITGETGTGTRTPSYQPSPRMHKIRRPINLSIAWSSDCSFAPEFNAMWIINQSEDGQVAPDHPIVRPVFSFGVELYRSALVAEHSRSPWQGGIAPLARRPAGREKVARSS